MVGKAKDRAKVLINVPALANYAITELSDPSYVELRIGQISIKADSAETDSKAFSRKDVFMLECNRRRFSDV